ncbi:hypothetical protein N7481_006304 [Penicillium waksmanii]|uniref:uncharacterized protein n=1 Tax=Penicillium waksmanii TaxID=69791 RepID=UPI00254789CD|nr:uncharacterized protein N7481_006304 [Penicillium waksmanii]KAJ5984205.1 hypothetical protein N7481_006304 [Penicillium waksmanii]
MHWLPDSKANVVDPVWGRLNALLTLVDLVGRRVLQHAPAAKFGSQFKLGGALRSRCLAPDT